MRTDPLAAARALLPAWVTWSPLLGTALATALAALLAGVVLAWTGRELRRLSPEAHWTVRARAIWRTRLALWVSLFPACLIGGPLLVGGALSLPALPLRFFIHLALPSLLMIGLLIRLEDRWVRRLPLGTRLRSLAAHVLLLYPSYLVAAVAALTLPWLGSTPVATLVAVGLLLAAWMGATWPLGRVLGLVGPAPERARVAVDRAAQALGVGAPPVWLVQVASANAFAGLLRPAVLVTSGALQALDDDGLTAVMAHELGHLREARRGRVVRAAGTLALPLALVLVGPVYLAWGAPGTFGVLFAGLLAMRLQRRHARAAEVRADAEGSQASPTYARALERLHEFNLTPAALGRGASHPDLADRMAAAGVTPGWTRPAPPRSILPVALVLLALQMAGATGLVTWRGGWGGCGEEIGEQALLVSLALDGGSCELAWLASVREDRGDVAGALTLLDGADALVPDGQYLAWRAHLLLRAGRCEEADRALRAAVTRGHPAEELAPLEARLAGCAPAP